MAESTRLAALRQRCDALSSLIASAAFADKPALERLDVLEQSAYSLLHLASEKQDVATLHRAIAVFEHAVDTAPVESQRHGMAVLHFCNALATLYRWTADDNAWQKATDVASRWAQAVAAADARALWYRLAEATLLYHRSQVSGRDVDAAAAVDALEYVRTNVEHGGGVYCAVSTLVAELRLANYQKTHALEELERSIRDAVSVADAPQASNEQRRSCLLMFAQALVLRYEALRSDGDLSAAIAAGTAGVADGTSDHDAAKFSEVLARAHRHRYRISLDSADLDVAMDAYRRVVQYVEKTGDATQRAVSLDNYANGLAERHALTDNIADLLEVIAASRAGLAMLPDGSPHRARLLSNLGRSLVQQYEATQDAAVLTEAAEVCRRGLEEATDELGVAPRLHLALAEAILYKAAASPTPASLLRDALDHFVRGRELALAPAHGVPIYDQRASEALLVFADHEVATLLWLAEFDARAADTLLKRALEVGEWTKDRALAMQYARGSLPPPAGVSEGLVDRERLHLARLKALDSSEAEGFTWSPARVAYHRHRREDALNELNSIWRQMVAEDPAAVRYVAMRQSPDRAWFDRINELGADTFVLSLLSVPCVQDGSNHGRQGLVAIGLRAGMSPIVIAYADSDLTSSAAQRFHEEVLVDAGRGLCTETWSDALCDVLRDPPQALRQGCNRLIVSPPRNGRDVPWHLVLQRAGWQTDDGSPLPVTTIPTLAMLLERAAEPSPLRWIDIHDVDDAKAALRRMPQGDWSGPLVIGNPTGDLPAAESEACRVAEMLHVQPLIGPMATLAALRDALHNAPVIHVAGHARFDSINPMDSVIQLADGQMTARELIGAYCQAKLVVLSVCEGASARRGIGGEVVGLADALLRSGARAIVARLWRADDDATAFLMTLFYDNWLWGADYPAALAEAMKATSDQPSWRSPYYWSGFVLLSE